VQRSLEGCAIGGARGVEYYFLKPQWSSGKIYAPGGPSSGQKGSILLLEYFFYFGAWSEAPMGGGARSAPFGVLMSPKRRVRAAHGRALVIDKFPLKIHSTVQSEQKRSNKAGLISVYTRIEKMTTIYSTNDYPYLKQGT
jgi:hypothetical protein